MSTRYPYFLAVFACALPTFAQAGESAANLDDILAPEVVVTADRIETPIQRTTSAVTVISRKEIERSGKSSVVELLRDVPGVTVISSGGTGQLTQAYLRGMPSGQTLVLIDGIKMNDPLNTERFYDFANLSVAEIEKIEIVRGAQSVVHGSDSIGGVIQIFTRRGGSAVPRTRYGVSGGTYGTLRSHLGVDGSRQSTRYSLGVERLTSSGFSVANESRGNTETDSREIDTLSASVGHAWGSGAETTGVARFSYSRNELDDFDFVSGVALDDLRYITRDRTLNARVQHELPISGELTFKIGQNGTLSRRVTDNPPPSLFAANRLFYSSNRYKTDATLKWKTSQNLTLLLVGEYDREFGAFSEGNTIESGLAQDMRSAAAEAQWGVGRWSTSTGIRWDEHSRSGDALTARSAHRIGLGGGLDLKGSIGTGFKAPTLYQLYYPGGGNLDLKPEKSASAEIGAELRPDGFDAVVGLTLFRTQVRDQIEWPGAGYINNGRTLVEGAEWSARRDWGAFDLRVAATRLFVARNELTRADLAQRPKLAIAWNPGWDVNTKLRLDGQFRFHGKRMNGSPSVELPSYTLVELGGRWQWSPGLTLTGRIENALDRKYEEVLGYATPGRAITLGIEGAL